jgi:iron complex transport system permease protein
LKRRTLFLKKQHKHIIFFSSLIVLTVLLFFLSLIYGSVNIPLKEVWHALLGNPTQKESWLFIVNEFRLPKALMALLDGMALSVAGLLMQTLFRNPLAGPYVLGISNGASLGVAILVLSGGLMFGFQNTNPWAVATMAVIGSGLLLALVLLLSLWVRDNVSLLIMGIMVGSITGAIVSVLQYFSNPEAIQSYVIWTFGSLSGANWQQLIVLTPIVFSGLIMAFASQKALNTLLIGEAYSRSLGISIKRTRLILIISTTLLAGGVTAFSGPIAFLGLAAPHIARSLLNTSDHKVLIPASLLLGATLLLTCDIIAQVPGYNTTLPLNAVTALFGAPIVIWVILKSKHVNTSL